MEPVEQAIRKKTRRTIWLVAGGFVLLLALYFLPPVIDAYLDLKREGVFNEVEQSKYEGTSMENLKALYQANQLYYEANEVMPSSEAWMDELSFYVRTADLEKGEEAKKFVNPRLEGGANVFGYAFNSSLSGAWMENIENPALTPLFFESKDTAWNAHGDPVDLQPIPQLAGGNKAVTVDGATITLKELLEKTNN